MKLFTAPWTTVRPDRETHKEANEGPQKEQAVQRGQRLLYMRWKNKKADARENDHNQWEMTEGSPSAQRPKLLLNFTGALGLRRHCEF